MDIPWFLCGVAAHARYQHEQSGLCSSYLFGGDLAESVLSVYFLTCTDSLIPPDWSIVLRDEQSEQEQSFGYWWPRAHRPYEHCLLGIARTTIHCFAGSTEHHLSWMVVHSWREPVVVSFQFLDQAREQIELLPEAAKAGGIEEAVERRCSLLIGPGVYDE